MNFARICALQWTKVKWCFERGFYHFTIFGFKNQTFEENNGLECIFFELKNGCFQTHLADLKKHQTSDFLLMNDFL